MQKKKVLLIAEAVTIAHVARIISLANNIDLDQFEIAYAFDQRYRKFLDTDRLFFHLASIEPLRFMESVNNYRFPYSISDLTNYVESDLNLLDVAKPDVVIGDFRISLAISTQQREVPYISITNSYWLPNFAEPLNPPDHFFLNLFPLQVSKVIFDSIRPIIFKKEAKPFNVVARHFGVESVMGSLLQVYTQADHILVAEPKNWTGAKESENVSFIGPLRWSPQNEKPLWWSEIDSSKKTIYISVGSSGSGEMLSAVVDALGGLSVQIIFSGRADFAKNVPSGITIFKDEFLSNRDMLTKADLFISNGGSLSMVDALILGKPIIGLTSNYDQYLNAGIFEREGVGFAFKQSRIKTDQLRSAIMKCLNPDEKMQQRLRQVQDIFSRPIDRALITGVIERISSRSKAKTSRL